MIADSFAWMIINGKRNNLKAMKPLAVFVFLLVVEDFGIARHLAPLISTYLRRYIVAPLLSGYQTRKDFGRFRLQGLQGCPIAETT